MISYLVEKFYLADSPELNFLIRHWQHRIIIRSNYAAMQEGQITPRQFICTQFCHTKRLPLLICFDVKLNCKSGGRTAIDLIIIFIFMNIYYYEVYADSTFVLILYLFTPQLSPGVDLMWMRTWDSTSILISEPHSQPNYFRLFALAGESHP